MELTVVIPTYNEAANLPALIEAVFALPLSGSKVLIIDDDSPDGTGRIADEIQRNRPNRVSVIHRAGKAGLGSAYITGFKKAIEDGAEAVAQMDADFSHPPGKLIEMLNGLADHDVAMGSRYISGGSVDRDWPAWRKGLSTFGNFYARSILRLPIRDVTGGFRAWRRETLLGIPLHRIRSNGYAFQVEMAYLAYCSGFSFCEVPFYFADRRWGTSKMSFKIQLEAAIRVWQMLYEYRDLPKISRSSPRLIHT
jgi:dolichol-phosphate mannosyltransferase